jgi:ATP-dependent RNA helicase DHX36
VYLSVKADQRFPSKLLFISLLFYLHDSSTSSLARRISAISIAERVAEEQCLGADQIGSLVGYQVRLESASSKDTQLLFLTPGVLLRKLQSSPMLEEYTHIVIDEVHERDRYTEFLMIRLRDLLPLRPDLRLVLMSATLQTETLMSYFSNCDHPYYSLYPPVMLSIEGRTFPVQEYFLEHVLELTSHIDLAAYPDDYKNNGGATSAPPPMTMDQLDAELARLLMSNGAPAVIITDSSSSSTPLLLGDSELVVKCAMCGKIFADPVELGEHVALCTGLNYASPSGMNDVASSHSAVSNEDVTVYEDFEEYDVDGTQDVAEYQFQEVAAYSWAGPPGEAVVEKWDGEGVFQANVEQESVLTGDQEKYLDLYQSMHDDEQIDTDLLLELLHYIHKSSYGEGAILVFLPGWQEISECSLLLKNTPPFNNSSKFSILPLHSGIPSSDQRKVLRRPPLGVRKIILSTNIAGTLLMSSEGLHGQP